MDNRKKKILQVVVQSYIVTGRPVGSRTIAENYDLGVSTATIRNEMAMLEKMGFLVQPHTSAGRVPTDAAYRYYVDALMAAPPASPGDTEAVEMLFTVRTREIEGLFEELSLLLSNLTRSTAMVFAPLNHADTIRHVDVVRMDGRRLMLLVITSSGQVGRSFISPEAPVNTDTVEKLVRYLDEELRGKGQEQIDRKDLLARADLGAGGNELLGAVIDSTREYLGTIEERVFVGGTSNIIREADHAGMEWVRDLLEAMEKQYVILDLLKDLIRENGLTVLIGSENRLEELRRCALVGASYPVSSGLRGSIGVVGPTYMDYARAIGTVDYVAKNLERRLSMEVEQGS